MNHGKKNRGPRLGFHESSWLFNRDPKIMVYEIIPMYSLYSLNNQFFFIHVLRFCHVSLTATAPTKITEMKQTSWSLFRFRDPYFMAYEIKPCKTGISSPCMQQITMIDPLHTANHQCPVVTSRLCFKVKQRNLLARRTSTRTLEYPLPPHLRYPESIVEYP